MISDFTRVEISHLQLPASYDAELAKAAGNSGYSKHDLIRMAVEEFLVSYKLVARPLLYPAGEHSFVGDARRKIFKRISDAEDRTE